MEICCVHLFVLGDCPLAPLPHIKYRNWIQTPSGSHKYTHSFPHFRIHTYLYNTAIHEQGAYFSTKYTSNNWGFVMIMLGLIW